MRDQIIQNRIGRKNYIVMNFTDCSFPSGPKISRSSKTSIETPQSTHKQITPRTPSKSRSNSKTRLSCHFNQQYQYTKPFTSPDHTTKDFLKDDTNSKILYQSSHKLQIDYSSLKPTNSISNYLDMHNFSSRQLLPRFMTERIIPELEYIEKISDTLDQYLKNVSSKKKLENFDSLNKYFSESYAITIQLKHLQFIDNLIPHFYELYYDPLKNIIVGAEPQKLKSQLRKRSLRRCLIQFQELNQQISEMFGSNSLQGKFAWIIKTDKGQEKVFREFQPIHFLKISHFFPEKQIRNASKNLQQDRHREKKAHQNFIQQIQNFVSHKNQKYQSIYKRVGSMVLETTKLLLVLKLFRKFYLSKNINNVFKATLINLLIRQHLMPEQQAVTAVQYILKVPDSCLKVTHVHSSVPIINFYQYLYKKTAQKLRRQQTKNTSTEIQVSQISNRQ